MAYEVYCYYNVDMLEAVFNGIAMILNGGAYAYLVKTVLTLGVIIMAMVSLSSGRFEGMKWIVVASIFYIGFLGPKTNIVLVDRITAQPPKAVANIPVGLAFMAHFTSSVGDWMTTTMESAFTVLPNTLKFGADPVTLTSGQTYGLMFGAKLLADVRRTVIIDPYLRMDWSSFIRNCTVYDIIEGRLEMNTMQNHTNLVDYLGNTSQARMTSYHQADASVVINTCLAVHGVLKTRHANDAQKSAVSFGKWLNPNIPGGTPDAAIRTIVNQQTSDTTQLMLGASADAVALIQQASILNMLDSSGATIGQQLDDPSMVGMAMAQAQAEAQTNSSYTAMARVAESAMPKIRNVIEVVVYAAFPIVMLIILIAGHRAGMPLKAYFMTMVWLQLWPPLYAILNMVSTMELAKATVAVASTKGAGLTIASAAAVGETSLSAQAIAGYMVMLIPVIAGAITKGGEQAMTSLASSLTAPSQAAASKAGTDFSSGNLSYGNVSHDNVSAHNSNMWKTDHNFSHKSGMMTLQHANGAVGNFHADGSLSGAQAKNDLLIGGAFTQSNTKGHHQEVANAVKDVKTSETALTNSVSSSLGNEKLYSTGANGRITLTDDARKNMSDDAVEAHTKSAALAQHIKETTGVEQSEATTMAGVLIGGGNMQGAIAAVQARTKGGRPMSGAMNALASGVNAKAQGEGKLSGQRKDADTIENSSQLQEARESSKRFTESLQRGESATRSKDGTIAGGDSLKASFNEIKTAQESYKHATTKEQSAQEGLKKAQEESLKFEHNLMADPNYFNQLATGNPWVDKGGTAHNWNAATYLSATPEQREAMNEALKKGMGISTDKAAQATDATTGRSAQEQLAANGKAAISEQHGEDMRDVGKENNANQRQVRDKQDAGGVGDPSAVASGAQKLFDQTKGGLMTAQSNMYNSGLDLGQRQEKFDQSIKEGNARSAFEALGDAIKDNPALAGTIAASGVLGTLAGAVEGHYAGKHQRANLPGPGGIDVPGGPDANAKKVADLARGAEKASDLKDIERLEKVLQGARGVRAGIVGGTAASGVGLPAAAVEFAVSEAAFQVIGAVLEHKKNALEGGPAEATAPHSLEQPAPEQPTSMSQPAAASDPRGAGSRDLSLSRPDDRAVTGKIVPGNSVDVVFPNSEIPRSSNGAEAPPKQG